jgi:glycosyltransferase involved in cell wall biosynthesis
MGVGMRIGTIAYSTATGLGYQVKSYIKHLPVTKIMNIDLSELNGLEQFDWYPNAYHVRGYPTDEQIRDFCNDIDILLFAETPLNYNFYAIARERGIKTVNVINWEFFDHIDKPDIPLPDMIIMPSMWHYSDARDFCASRDIRCIQLHHPVDREEITFRQRTSNIPMHLAGKPASNDRNGTWLFLEACPDGTVVTQSDDLAWHIGQRFRHATVHTKVRNNDQIYTFGDIMVLPRRYGGNCLPLNEALASGMPVIMPDIEPNNSILPKEWLVPAQLTDRFTPRTVVDIYTADTTALANKISELRSMDIGVLSKQASEIADTISWETLRPKYIEALESLL